MSETTLPPIESLIDLARRAGDAILEIYHTDFSVQNKEDRSPLTAADLASHRIIVEELRGLTPKIPILSEESATIPFETRRSWRRYWLIDPLDGTKEFIKRNGEFTVNIALIEEQRSMLGIVYVPVSGVLYFGGEEIGAFREAPEEERRQIAVCSRHQSPVRVAGSRSHASEGLQQLLANLGPHELVSMGSSLKFCLVAEGSVDLYPRLGPTCEWDTAAAQAVVEAAGGKVTDLQLRPLRYNTKESLLNPNFLVFGDTSADWSQFLSGVN